MCVKIERAGDYDVEPGIRSLTCGSNEIGPSNGAKFRAEENSSTALLISLHVAPFGADQFARPRCERCEADPVFLVRLLDTSRLAIFEDHLCEIGLAFF